MMITMMNDDEEIEDIDDGDDDDDNEAIGGDGAWSRRG